jgi:exodeoxyribonuclease V alpha subunit
LAYGISLHKAQGSDWPWTIIMIDDYPGARRICDRSWIYTAISRAKTKCILIGNKKTAFAMSRFSNIHKRKTFLREEILFQSSAYQLAEV